MNTLTKNAPYTESLLIREKILSDNNPKVKSTQGLQALKIKKVLGYGVLQEKIEKEIAKNYHHPQLIDAFNELEIHPFTQSSVEKYMDLKLEDANHVPVVFESPNKFGLDSIVPIMGVSLGISLVFESVVIYNVVLFACGSVLTMGSLKMLCDYSSLFRVQRSFPRSSNLYQWEKIEISNYKNEVPEWALNMATELKERVPASAFYIHELKEKTKIDPFLSVVCGEKEYFIAQWDEPGFKTERVI